MQTTRPIIVPINRPFADVQDFLGDQMNFARWATVPGTQMEPLGANEWLVELPHGRSVIRFTPRNPYGVLDYRVRGADESGPGHLTSVRLVANEEGTDLVLILHQRPGVDQLQFDSEAEWVTSDLQRLKSLIEVR